MLDVLKASSVRATFFLVAHRAAVWPELVARAVEEGHEVGLHCGVHRKHTEMSRSALESDTAAAVHTLSSLGAIPRRWRPPWGVISDASGPVARAHSLQLVGWTIDSRDWMETSARLIVSSVMGHLRPGAVVRFHDGSEAGSHGDGGLPDTLAAVPHLAEQVREAGFEPVPMAELGEQLVVLDDASVRSDEGSTRWV